MAILKGIKIEGSEEVHQIDYEEAVANKPFETLSTETLFEWDGNVDGLEHWDITDAGQTMPYYYKVNSQTPAKEKFIGAVATGVVSGEEMLMEITEDYVSDGLGNITGCEDKCFMVAELGLVVLEKIDIVSDELPSEIHLTSGTWHANPALAEGTYVKSIIKENIKYIDEKYIPKSFKVADEEKVPDVTSAKSGSFLRVINGVATWQQLTDVSEVGA